MSAPIRSLAARYYTDPEVFAGREGQGFLLRDGAVVEARADDDSVSLVQQLLDTEAGNPLGARLGS